MLFQNVSLVKKHIISKEKEIYKQSLDNFIMKFKH